MIDMDVVGWDKGVDALVEKAPSPAVGGEEEVREEDGGSTGIDILETTAEWGERTGSSEKKTGKSKTGNPCCVNSSPKVSIKDLRKGSFNNRPCREGKGTPLIARKSLSEFQSSALVLKPKPKEEQKKAVKVTVEPKQEQKKAVKVTVKSVEIEPLESPAAKGKEEDGLTKQINDVRWLYKTHDIKAVDTHGGKPMMNWRADSFNLLERSGSKSSTKITTMEPLDGAARLDLPRMNSSSSILESKVRRPSAEEENKLLREEILSLKQALVEGMRGGNRFVSGGQFRTRITSMPIQVSKKQQQQRPSSSQQAERPQTPVIILGPFGKGDEYSRARSASSLGVRNSSGSAATTTGKFLVHANGNTNNNSRSSSSSNNNNIEMRLINMRHELDIALDERIELLAQLEGQSHFAKELTNLQRRLEDENHKMSKLRQIAAKNHERVILASQQLADRDELIKQLQRQVGAFKLDAKRDLPRAADASSVAALTDQLTASKQASKEQLAASKQAAKEHKQEVLSLLKENKELKMQSSAEKKDKNELKKQLVSKQEALEDLERQVALKDAYVRERDRTRGEKEALEQQQEELFEKLLATEKEKSKLTRELEEAKLASGDLQKVNLEKNNELTETQEMGHLMKLRLDAVNRDCIKLKESQIKAKVVAQALRVNLESTRLTLKKVAEECDELKAREDKSIILEQVNKKLKAELRSILAFVRTEKKALVEKEELEEKEQTLLEKAEMLEIRSLDLDYVDDSEMSALFSACELVKTFRSIISSSRSKVAELESSAASLAREAKLSAAQYDALTKQALENVMHSAIRLCVIAPTVNVNLNNKHALWQQQLTPNGMAAQTATMRGPLPVEDIRHVVQNKVLPLFAKTFVQKQKDLAPDNRTSLDAWMESLVQTMQQSIERNLKHAFVHHKRVAPG